MKLPLLLAATGLTCALLAAASQRQSLLAALPGPDPAAEAASLLSAFARASTPTQTLDIDALPQTRTDPRLAAADPAPLSDALQCIAADGAPDPSRPKVLLWNDLACGLAETSLHRLLHTPPYLHPSGRSYAALALRGELTRDLSPPLDPTDLTPLLHLSELPLAAAAGAHLTADEALLARLPADTLRLVLAGAPAAASADLVLLRDADRARRYTAYPLEGLRTALATTPLDVTRATDAAPCLARAGNLCFGVNETRARTLGRRAQLLGTAALAAFLAAAAVAALHRARLRRRDARERAFLLQLLTHELRTPAASLRLSLETLRRRFDVLPDDAQHAFLRLCDDAGRLGRVIDASRQYLSGDAAGTGVHLRPVDIDSLQDWLAGLLEAESTGDAADVVLDAPAAPVRARVDPYWFGVCVRNLVANARAHGAPPVRLRVEPRRDRLHLCVEDAGTAPTLSPREMLRPFVRGPRSGGLGLGLSVVERLTREMGGELRIDAAPTRFTLVLPVHP